MLNVLVKRMFDDNFAAAARAAASAADDDDDDYTLQHDSDKPGFVRWAEALNSRHISTSAKCSIGYWDSARDAVVLTQTKGKKQSVMGFSSDRKRCLHAEEALYLIDDGQLVLMTQNPETGEDLRPGMSRTVAGAPPAGPTELSSASVRADMTVDDDRPGKSATSSAVAASAAVAAKNQPSWKSNDDLLEQLLDEAEAADGDQDGDYDDEGADEDSYDESEERHTSPARHSAAAAVPSTAALVAKPAEAAAATAASTSCRAVHADRDQYLSLPAAYMFLLEKVPLHRYLVYQHLRSLGLVALRHDPASTMAALPARPATAAADAASAASDAAAVVAAPSADADGRAAAATSAHATAAAAGPEVSLPPVHLLHKAGLERHMFAPAREGEPQRSNSSGFAPPSLPEAGSATSSATAAAPSSSSSVSALSRWIVTAEADVTPDYDVYARDGISAFKLSAPGPPDFYVAVQT